MGIANWMNGWTAIFPLAVLLYYFFRKRYEIQTISSTLFWEQSMQETKVSPYLKNLQRNALFYLQMLALLLFVFLLLGPFIDQEEVMSDHVILIADTSASMLVEKKDGTLFSEHQERMKKLVDGRVDQAVTLITTGKEPTVILREETDPQKVLDAIGSLTVNYEHEFMDRSIEFAQSIAASSSADIHVYTDSFDRAAVPEGDGKIGWTINSNPDMKMNVSIDKFGAVQSEDGIEAIVKISNQSEEMKQGEIHIKDGLTGVLIAKEIFEIEALSDLLESFKDLPNSKAVHAELVVEDSYKADNSAYALLGNEKNEAIIDGNLHELVKKAFEAAQLEVTIGSVNEMSQAQEISIIVTNDVSFLEKGTNPIILIGRNDSTAEPVSGVVESTTDPLFSIVDISNVYVSELYPPVEGLTTIASIDEKPFIQKSSRGDVVILADIEKTDWPLHPSFPLFIWSSAELLRTEANVAGSFTPNQRKSIVSSEIELFTNEDEYVTTFTEGSSFRAPEKPGIYKLREGENEKLFTVQLEDDEKEVLTNTSFTITKTNSDGSAETGKKFIAVVFLPLFILMIMLIEWEVQRRRGYPN
ncbi:BatA and WFA domain-containing protein [Sporosarcina siberiensis]|uniref:BatA and WFA domain-containing protein n=1 Tax=Sporosarcina siberiensis TaxID=1365606 RepID=A0ABW4SKS4_9BACL